MNIEELFCGVGMVVDDQIYNEESKDGILPIVKALEQKGFPLAKYDNIPDVDALSLCRCSFLLLDWELVSLSDEGSIPIQIPDELSKDKERELINFLKEVLSECYFPIFIFSNKEEMFLKERLKANGIKIEEDNLPIFIKHKEDIVNGGNVKVFETIREWVYRMPSIYILKVWENAVERAKVKTFKEFSKTKYWPSILWTAANNDGVNPQAEIMDVITQNVLGRMLPLSIDREQIEEEAGVHPPHEDILRVLVAQRLDSHPSKELPQTGDIYYLEDEQYYINIRPSCDCVIRPCNPDPDIYLVCCQEIEKVKSVYSKKNGNFCEKINEAIIGPLMDNRFYSFNFFNLYIKKYSELKDKKVGRVLPPFIRHITERYAQYIQRQGLPRIPNEAILGSKPASPENDPNFEESKEIGEKGSFGCLRPLKRCLVIFFNNIRVKCLSLCHNKYHATKGERGNGNHI